MGKSRTNRYGQTKEQSLQHEVDKLKKLVAQLRKSLARVDLDHSSHVRNIVNDYYQREDAERHAEKEREGLEELKREWICNSCNSGHLEIILLNKMNNLHYYRVCTNCTHRTKLQPYNKNVRGIVKKTKE